MPSYMLLLHEEPDVFDRMSPEDFQQVIERYRAWSVGLEESGHYLASDKLTDGEGRVLRKTGDTVRVTDGPFAETKEVIGGYFTISAAGYDEAVALARDCPHLDYGGSIEVREIDRMGAAEDEATAEA
ncbi:MAG: YciI family protein [Acidobacteriota bacterium]|jgi:hypothetical protein